MARANVRKDGKIPRTLTSAEVKVAYLITEGWSNKDIALILKITPKTVKYHATSIYLVTGLDTRSKFIVNYYKTGDYYKPKKESK
jgi:DNA-binding NarL/FixJ family response regulator